MAGNTRQSRRVILLALCLVGIALGGTGARAAVFSSTPSLPPLNVPFVSAGVGCFQAAALCIQPGSVTFTSATSTFDLSGQDIVANAVYTGTLTDLSHNALGPVVLTGTLEEEVLGRTFSTETGTWSTEIKALLLAGAVQGHTLTLKLGAPPSTGVASVESIGNDFDAEGFLIDSFFDVFVDLTLDTPTPLHTTLGPIHLAIAVPEPTSIALVGTGLLLLAGVRQRVRSLWSGRSGARKPLHIGIPSAQSAAMARNA